MLSDKMMMIEKTKTKQQIKTTAIKYKSKSFEEQIKLLEKRKDLQRFWPYNDHGDKELKSKYFKIELAKMLKIIDKKLFEQIFGYTLEILANKLINTTNKEENQIIVNNIHKIKINFIKR